MGDDMQDSTYKALIMVIASEIAPSRIKELVDDKLDDYEKEFKERDMGDEQIGLVLGVLEAAQKLNDSRGWTDDGEKYRAEMEEEDH